MSTSAWAVTSARPSTIVRSSSLDDRAPRVLYKLALAYYRNGQAAMAIEPLRRAVAMDDAFARGALPARLVPARIAARTTRRCAR